MKIKTKVICGSDITVFQTDVDAFYQKMQRPEFDIRSEEFRLACDECGNCYCMYFSYFDRSETLDEEEEFVQTLEGEDLLTCDMCGKPIAPKE